MKKAVLGKRKAGEAAAINHEPADQRPLDDQSVGCTVTHPMDGVVVVDRFLDPATISQTLAQLDDRSNSTDRCFDQINPDSGTRSFRPVVLPTTVGQALCSALGYSRIAPRPIELPASRTSGSVPRHRDRHGLDPARPLTRGPTAVIYLTDGGDLVFDSGQHVSAAPGRLIMFGADTPHAFHASDPFESRAMVGPFSMRHGQLEACWASFGGGGPHWSSDEETEEERIERERLEAIEAEKARLLRLVPILSRLRRDARSRLSLLPPQLLDRILEYLGWVGCEDPVISGLRVRGLDYDHVAMCELLSDLQLLTHDDLPLEVHPVNSGISSTCLRVVTTHREKFFVKLPPTNEAALVRCLEDNVYLVESMFYSRVVPALSSQSGPRTDWQPSTQYSLWQVLPRVLANHYDYSFDDFVLVLENLADYNWASLSSEQEDACAFKLELNQSRSTHPLYVSSSVACWLAEIHCSFSANTVQQAAPFFAALARRPGASSHVPLASAFLQNFSASIELLESIGAKLPEQFKPLCLSLAQPGCGALQHFIENEIQNRLPLTLCHGDLNPGNIGYSVSQSYPLYPWLSVHDYRKKTRHAMYRSSLCIVDWQHAHLGYALRDVSKMIALNCPEHPHPALLAYFQMHALTKRSQETELCVRLPELITEYIRYTWLLLLEMLATVGPSFARQFGGEPVPPRVASGLRAMAESLCAALCAADALDATAPLFPFPALRVDHGVDRGRALVSSLCPALPSIEECHFVFTVGVMDRLHAGHRSLLHDCASACQERGWSMKIALTTDGANWVSTKTCATITQSFETRASQVCDYWAEIAPNVPLQVVRMTNADGVSSIVNQHRRTLIVVDEHNDAKAHVNCSLAGVNDRESVELRLVAHVDGISSSTLRCSIVHDWWYRTTLDSSLQRCVHLDHEARERELNWFIETVLSGAWVAAGTSKANTQIDLDPKPYTLHTRVSVTEEDMYRKTFQEQHGTELGSSSWRKQLFQMYRLEHLEEF